MKPKCAYCGGVKFTETNRMVQCDKCNALYGDFAAINNETKRLRENAVKKMLRRKNYGR